MSAPPWDSIQAEYGDVLQGQRKLQKRDCAGGCGRITQATSGYCMDCQPSLLEPVSTPFQRGETAQIGPDDPWPEGF